MVKWIKKEGGGIMKAEMKLPEGALYIINRLVKLGHRADVVGGCVRDFLLGRPSDDYDICTSASPDEIKAAFSDIRTVDTGIKHGTVTVVKDGVPYEVTTYRIDGEYTDNRHPESVTFTTELSEDLARRDFTVNAMCYNPRDGFTDLFSGTDDLAASVIRAVGDPCRRFDEDALRILRALRFASVLDFALEEGTAAAVHAKAHLLAKVSRERVYAEWRKLLSGKGAYRILSEYPDVISVIIPELSDMKLPEREAFESADAASRQLSLYYLGAELPSEYFHISMRSLKADNTTRIFGEQVLAEYGKFHISSIADALMLLRAHGEAVVRGIVRLGILLGDYDVGALRQIDAALESGIPYRVSELAVGGNDLMALGITGRNIGITLEGLLDSVIRGKCKNEKALLLSCVKESLRE